MGIVASAILFFGLATVWYAFRDVSVILRNELEQRAIAVGNSLARQSRNHILTDNQFALYNVITGTVSTSNDIVYAFVLDHYGNVLVHSFDNGFPSDLLNINPVPSGLPYRVQEIQTGEESILDVGVSVLDGKAGSIHLGMSEKSIGAAVRAYVKMVMLWVGLALILGLLFAYLVATFLTKPLSALAREARSAGSGDFRWQAPPWARDELGELGSAFGKMDSELKRKEAMRTLLLAKVIHAQEEERKRIARELHDESGQTLTSLMVNLKTTEDSADSPHLKKKLSELRTQAASTLDRLRHLSKELRPSLLDDVGLPSALQKYIREYAAQTGISVECRLGEIEKISLSPDEETTIYRIVQEALTNIVKHAGASRVSVVAGLSDSNLVVIVEDNGKGFDIEKLPAGDDTRLGIFGMEERAGFVGGKVTFESIPGEGTTLFLDLPVKSRRTAA